jgi:hypothetical protein
MSVAMIPFAFAGIMPLPLAAPPAEPVAITAPSCNQLQDAPHPESALPDQEHVHV